MVQRIGATYRDPVLKAPLLGGGSSHEVNMKHSSTILLTLLLFIAVAPSITCSQENKLLGVWECYKQEDKAKAQSCFYSLEFHEDGTMITKGIVWGPGQIIEQHHRFSAASGRIDVTDAAYNNRWHFDYKFMKNGDLFVYKPPWNYRGWFTRDHSKVPADYGCHWATTLPIKNK
jgi:hypothetical protein